MRRLSPKLRIILAIESFDGCIPALIDITKLLPMLERALARHEARGES